MAFKRKKKPWRGVDLDGTLATYSGWQGPGIIGEPIPRMVLRVKFWLTRGESVKILTARVSHPEEAKIARPAIQAWCKQHIGQVLPVTCKKDFGMIELWDDRAVQVEPNTGKRMDGRID